MTYLLRIKDRFDY